MAQTPENSEKRSGMEPQLGNKDSFSESRTYKVWGREIQIPEEQLILEKRSDGDYRLEIIPFEDSNAVLINWNGDVCKEAVAQSMKILGKHFNFLSFTPLYDSVVEGWVDDHYTYVFATGIMVLLAEK